MIYLRWLILWPLLERGRNKFVSLDPVDVHIQPHALHSRNLDFDRVECVFCRLGTRLNGRRT